MCIYIYMYIYMYAYATYIPLYLKESACIVGDPGLGDPLEKGMATHSSILACRIPWTEEPGGLQSVGLQRVGHD